MRRAVPAVLTTVLSVTAFAQWQPFEAPTQPGSIVATGRPGEVLVDSDRTTRIDLKGGKVAVALAELPGLLSITASPDAPGVLYAVALKQYQWLWRSVDCGSTWHELKIPRLENRLDKVAAGSFASGRVVATGFAEGRSLLLSSADGGFSWAFHRGAADPQSSCQTPYGEAPRISAIAVHPRSPDVFLAAMNCGVARSVDGGASWKMVLAVADAPGQLAFSRLAVERVYLSGRASYRSADGGQSWEVLDLPASSSVQPDPEQPDVAWATNGGRILRSTDGGGAWTEPLPGSHGSLVLPGAGEIVSGSRRWDGQAWVPLSIRGGAPRELMAFARNAAGTFVGASFPYSISIDRSAHDNYRKVAGQPWQPGSAGQSFAVDPTTDTLYGLQWYRIGITTNATLFRLDSEGSPQGVVGGAGGNTGPLLGVVTTDVTRAAFACDLSSVCISELPLGTRATRVHTFPGEGVVAGHWSALGTFTVATIRGLYRDGRRLAQWATGQGPRSIAVAPGNDEWIFAAWPDGIRASFDGGLTWAPFDGGGVIEKAVVFAASDGLYASNARGMFFCPAFGCTGQSGFPRAALVELHHAARDEYFYSMNPAEVASLVTSRSGWAATGETIDALAIQAPQSGELVRFAGTPGVRPGAHFFTSNAAEAASLRADAGWVEERSGGAYVFPPLGGEFACGAGAPVYRAFNGKAGNPNHRFTTRLDTYRAMVDHHGWIGEGVAFCTP